MKKMPGDLDLSEKDVRRGYGFVESFSKPLDGTPYTRINIVLDVVDARAFDEDKDQARLPKHLSLVRIMTTPRRLHELFDVDSFVTEGEWFRVSLAPTPGMPRAWILEAEGDYSGAIISTNVVGLEKMDNRIGNQPYASDFRLDELRKWCRIATSVPQPSSMQTPSDLCVRVVDVGHANFSAIHVSRNKLSKIVGYFDVGGPVYFHHHTFPKAFSEEVSVPADGFVALSHWDFDHYSLAVTKLKRLQNLTWYAPDQAVGPNAARLQLLLGPRLNLLNGSTFQISNGIRMWRGTGAHSDRNNSGYVLTVTGNKGGTLLTGDVSYNAIPSAAKSNLAALGVTHHGGSGAGSPPAPASGSGAAAVSFGLPNRYHHPNWADLAAHSSIGWDIKPTYVDPFSRGDVWLP